MSVESLFRRSALFTCIWCLCACVNEDYDLNKDIDLNVNVLKNVSVPIGSLEMVKLNDIVDFSESSFIQSDDNGDLAIMIASDDNLLTQEITVPDFTFEDTYEGEIVEEYLGDFLFSYDSSIADYVDLSQISKPREFPDIPLYIEFEQTEIPEQIMDVRYAEVNATACINLSVRINYNASFTAWLSSGTELEFPDWIILGDVSGKIRKEGSSIVLIEDMPIPVSTPAEMTEGIALDIPVIGVDATKLPEGQGLTSDRKFVMKDNMTIRGKSYFTYDGGSFAGGGVISPIVSAMVSFSGLDIMNVEVLLRNDIEKDLVTGLSPVIIEDLPDIFNDPGIVLDINDIRVDIDFINSSPFAGRISANVSTSAGGEKLDDVRIGPVSFDAGTASHPAEMKWSFSEGKLQAPAGYILYEVEGLSDIIENVPEVIEFEDVELELEEEYVFVRPGDRYVLEQSYSIFAPLAFGPDFRISYTYEISDLDLELPAADLTSAILEMDVESTVPISFIASAFATDDNGEIVEGLDLTIDGDALLNAGSLESPALSHLKFILSNTTGEIDIDNVFIDFAASAAGREGVALNENQGLHFKNIILTLPEGISADLNEM